MDPEEVLSARSRGNDLDSEGTCLNDPGVPDLPHVRPGDALDHLDVLVGLGRVRVLVIMATLLVRSSGIEKQSDLRVKRLCCEGAGRRPVKSYQIFLSLCICICAKISVKMRNNVQA